MAQVTLNQLTKHFDDTPVVKGISLTVEDGEFFSLLGPSGCGKTTILRMIAGFTFPTSGTIFFDDQDVSYIPPNKRNTGMVFQNYALFPHMTVFENVAFGLRTRKVPKAEMADRVAGALKLVGLSGLEARPVPLLSGGQQQRVALARAVVIEPNLLLLDEPLSNLDAKLREETRDQIRDLQKQLGITTIYVTHDQEEALAVSDRIAVMDDGICQQLDTPDVIYRQPANRFVATFMGKMNLWEGTLADEDGQCLFRHESGLTILLPQNTTMDEGPAFLAMRPQTIKLSPDVLGNTTAGSVVDRQFKGATVEFVVEVAGERITIVTHSDDPIAGKQPGEEVWVQIPGDQAIVLKD
ncbi:MAG TPA: spermidine/putrescine ABC transporter ATP-binding protein [Candidatus Latescibacteria bacterium]|jgi:iron(III) transport system ATP-binding protein|nr:spermidine/putrescine ABC transporter ATP-binding protein [Candidatus Latescibacterota bacterium]